jgi:purine-binding chemotaxis protein CheW
MKTNGQSASSKNAGPAKAITNGAAQKKGQEIESIDWDRMRQRLSSLGSTVEDGIDTLSSDQIEQVWTQRAAQMSQVPESEETSEQLELVLLRVGRELLGVEVNYISAIRQNEPITRVPRVPAWVAGVVNLRGSILSVIDLRVFLGLPAAPTEEHTDGTTDKKSGLLVVTASREMQVVLLVDDVPGVEALRVKDIHIETNVLRGLRTEYVRGVYERHTLINGEERADPVIVLNIEALLSDHRIVVHDEPA